MATESSIGLPPDSTGKKLRSTEVTTAQGTVEQQVLNVADPTSGVMQGVNADGSANTRTTITSPNGAAAGIFAMLNAYGGQRVSVEPSVTFMDPFDGTLDTTNRWTTAGTAPALAVGALTVNASTVASATSRLTSQPTFASPGLGFEILATVLQVEAATTANVYRFWGWASDSGAPTYQAPLAANGTAVFDAVGFELDGAGNLYAVVYASGVNTYRSAAIPTAAWKDGGYHRYAIFKRSDIVFWYVEGQEVPVASIAYRTPNVQALPIKYGAYNNSTAPAAYTFNVNAAAVCDSTAQNATISDGAYPWRKASLTPLAGGKNGLDVNLAGSASGMSTTSGTLTGAGVSVTANVLQAGNVTVSLSGGSYTALSIIFEASDDNGITWFTTQVQREDGTGNVNQESFTAATSRMWTGATPGFTNFRVRAVSATITTAPTVRITPGPFLFEPSPVTNSQPMDGNKPTYIAYFDALSANIAGDIFVLLGSATKTIKISRVEVALAGGGTITAAQNYMRLALRTAPNTGGTTTAATFTKLDPADPAQTATAVGYTAAATSLGTGTVVRRQNYIAAAAGTATPPPMWTWDFGNRPEKMPTVRGTSQSFVVTNSAVAAGTAPTLSWSIYVQFTEE